jgi:hypothetical protein
MEQPDARSQPLKICPENASDLWVSGIEPRYFRTSDKCRCKALIPGGFKDHHVATGISIDACVSEY